MTPARKRRLALVAFMLTGIGAAVALSLAAFERNLLFFYTPTQIAAGEAKTDVSLRVGGVVEPGSVSRKSGELEMRFAVSDGDNQVVVRYSGLLPDLFAEGKGIVVRGLLGADGQIVADEVLAKHDENYKPPEAAEAIEKYYESNDSGQAQ